MADRMELNEQDLDNVVGGAFKFYDMNGQGMCKVSDVSNPGKYYCNFGTGVYEFMQMRGQNPGLSADEYLQMALDRGILRTQPDNP